MTNLHLAGKSIGHLIIVGSSDESSINSIRQTLFCGIGTSDDNDRILHLFVGIYLVLSRMERCRATGRKSLKYLLKL